MVKIMENKKGELTTTQLVTIIVLIVSFIIILFLIFRLNPGEHSNKEICHNSVVLRGNLVLRATSGGPLDCRTNYLCISGGDDCENLASASKVEVNLNNKDSENEIIEAVAKEMADCWYMFGEGKVNYGEIGSSTIKYAICSVVEFDEKIQKKYPEITYAEFYDYLRKTQKQSSQSYLNYLYGVNDVNFVIVNSQFKINVNNDKIMTNEKYSIITGIDDNPIDSDIIFKVYIIPTSETSSRLDEGEFITKA